MRKGKTKTGEGREDKKCRRRGEIDGTKAERARERGSGRTSNATSIAGCSILHVRARLSADRQQRKRSRDLGRVVSIANVLPSSKHTLLIARPVLFLTEDTRTGIYRDSVLTLLNVLFPSFTVPRTMLVTEHCSENPKA